MASKKYTVICEYGGEALPELLPELLQESLRLFVLRSLAPGRADVVSSSLMNGR